MASLRAFFIQFITLPILGGLAQDNPFGGIMSSLMQQLSNNGNGGSDGASGSAIAQALGSLMQGGNMQNPSMMMNPGMMNFNPGMLNPALQDSNMDTKAADSILTKIMADSLVQLSRTAPYEPELPTIDGIIRMIGTYFMGLFTSISPANAPPETPMTSNDASMSLLTNMMNMMSQMKGGGSQMPFGNMPMLPGNMPMSNGNMPMPSGNMPMPNGNMPMPNGNMPMPNGNMPMSSGNMPMLPGNMPVQPGNMPMPSGNMQMPSGNMPIQPGNMPSGNQMVPNAPNTVQNTEYLKNFKMPSLFEMFLRSLTGDYSVKKIEDCYPADSQGNSGGKGGCPFSRGAGGFGPFSFLFKR